MTIAASIPTSVATCTTTTVFLAIPAAVAAVEHLLTVDRSDAVEWDRALDRCVYAGLGISAMDAVLAAIYQGRDVVIKRVGRAAI